MVRRFACILFLVVLMASATLATEWNGIVGESHNWGLDAETTILCLDRWGDASTHQRGVHLFANVSFYFKYVVSISGTDTTWSLPRLIPAIGGIAEYEWITEYPVKVNPTSADSVIATWLVN